MEVFSQLGAAIERKWRERDYDEALFPAIAADALREAGLPEKVSAWDVIEWTMGETFLPVQQDVSGKFGDPPITLYNGPRFHIDVYFWLEGTTAIHQHAFCGAFQVLHGSSIHSWYDFKCRDRVNGLTEIGDISLRQCEILQIGDVQEILAGKQYIHGLFHLDQPSATIVVRTHKSPMFLPQYSYHKPFIAIDPFFEEFNTTKKLQCISALIRSQHPDTDRLIDELLENSDFQTTFLILSTVRSYLQNDELGRLFNLAGPADRFSKCLETAKKRHGARADVFPIVFHEQAKVTEIINRRSYVTDPEHRFFLALLMNVTGKEQIFSLIRQRFPDAEPLDKVLDWTFELAQTKVLGKNTPNALGLEDFGDFDLFVLENLLQDRSVAEIEAILRKEYPPEGVEGLLKSLENKAERIRRAMIFEPLLGSPWERDAERTAAAD